ncbi:MAG: alpha/beta hydrolase [Alphaproteobacteria bacterium]
MPIPFRKFVTTEYGQMHIRIARPDVEQDIPLICLHMSPQSGRTFEAYMIQASDTRCIIAPDYHGFGNSDIPPETPHVRIQDYARTIWQALDALNITKVDLVGHHTGSKVAAEMAFQHPKRVKGIVMISASVVDPKDVNAMERNFLPTLPNKDGTHLLDLWKSYQVYFEEGISLDIISKYVFETLRSGHASQWGNRAAHNYNKFFTEVLTSLEHPIVVINPNDDLYKVTPGVMKFLKNAKLINKIEWKPAFFDQQTTDAVETISKALSLTRI